MGCFLQLKPKPSLIHSPSRGHQPPQAIPHARPLTGTPTTQAITHSRPPTGPPNPPQVGESSLNAIEPGDKLIGAAGGSVTLYVGLGSAVHCVEHHEAVLGPPILGGEDRKLLSGTSIPFSLREGIRAPSFLFLQNQELLSFLLPQTQESRPQPLLPQTQETRPRPQ